MTDTEMNSTDNTELTDERMDELVNESQESNTREIPMSKEPEAPAPQDEKIEFTANGKKIQATRDQLIKWAQQGYDAPQKFQKFNQEKTQWETQRAQWEQQWGEYRKVDEWAQKNPDKWALVQKSFAQPGTAAPQTANPNDPYAPVIQNLTTELQQLKGVALTWQEQMAKQQQEKENQELDQEIQSIRDKYKDLDWSTPDENGKSLEYKVLEHARENGIKKFGTAFKDFYHDELISRAEAQAKQNVSKGIQTKTKMGILGESPTPKKGFAPVKDVKNKSYEDIMDEVRDELRSGAFG
jgi:hypothetical protein